MKLITGLLLLAMACGRPPAASVPAEPITLAIVDVRVVTGDAGRVLPRATVLVSGERIAQVGEGLAVPAGATVVDGRGQTLLPGLIDSHVHIHSAAQLEDALLLGVTTELGMYDSPAHIVALKAQVAGEREPVHADLRSSGHGATAPDGHGTQYGLPVPTLTTPGEAAAFVGARAGEGSDFLKIIIEDGGAYGVTIPTLDQATTTALVVAAHGRGLLAVAHVGSLANARQALASGVDGLVHLFIGPMPDATFGADAARAGVFVVPTLAVLWGFCEPEHGKVLARDARLAAALSAEALAGLDTRVRPFGKAPTSCEAPLATIRQLRAAGVPILAGTDAPNSGTAHGASMHEELALLVEAGLTPLEALVAATGAPARAFRLSDRGRIAPGLRADLLLVRGDPTVDITATREITGVWKAGRPVDRARGLAARVRREQDTSEPLVSDFEGGTPAVAFGQPWTLSTDAIAGGTSTGSLAVVAAPGRGQVLRVTGQVQGPLPYAWVGAAWFVGPGQKTAQDLSGKRRLSFWTRGDGGTYRLLVFTRRGGPAPAGTSFVAPPTWTEQTFELAKIPGLTTDDVIMILVAAGPGPGHFQLDLDDVRLE
jgi:imidazolonepropionase-like amidohydrolase